MTHDPEKPNIFYISNGSNTIFVTDRNQNFKILEQHKVI